MARALDIRARFALLKNMLAAACASGLRGKRAEKAMIQGERTITKDGRYRVILAGEYRRASAVELFGMELITTCSANWTDSRVALCIKTMCAAKRN